MSMLVTDYKTARASMTTDNWELYRKDAMNGKFGDPYDPNHGEEGEEVAFDHIDQIRYEMDLRKADGVGEPTKMNKATTRQVRQILMNELGITRESIREDLRELVAEEAGKVVTRMVSEDELEKIVIRAVRNELKDGRGWGSREKMMIAVENVAKEKAREIFDVMYPTSEQG